MTWVGPFLSITQKCGRARPWQCLEQFSHKEQSRKQRKKGFKQEDWNYFVLILVLTSKRQGSFRSNIDIEKKYMVIGKTQIHPHYGDIEHITIRSWEVRWRTNNKVITEEIGISELMKFWINSIYSLVFLWKLSSRSSK